jgi:hypothetical protein
VRDADPSPTSSAVVMKGESYTSTPPPLGRTACTEPQSLYKGALYLYLYLIVKAIFTDNLLKVAIWSGVDSVFLSTMESKHPPPPPPPQADLLYKLFFKQSQ